MTTASGDGRSRPTGTPSPLAGMAGNPFASPGRVAGLTWLPWWVFLITGCFWLVVSWVVLAFNTRSLGTVAVLAGIVILVAAVAELFDMFFAPGWRWLHGILGIVFLLTGFFAIINPGKTVFWLAAILGWYLLFKGAADIVLAFLSKREHDLWWVGLIVGVLEMLLGLWAAGRFFRSVALLVIVIGVIALTRAITDFVMAFRVRDMVRAAREG
ncbi:DUF308 domain-containing protein [Catellatospora sp. NPDC049609]|uniref:HdeD family acid-resistance protein n=1 Tax=Catellatospora sp. NPDC049609 TaxID=3155505 RepID=UPI00343A4B71